MDNFKILNLINYLKNTNYKLCTVESASCGMLANLIGRYPNISKFYMGGMITYWDNIKHQLLDIDLNLLNKHGTISHEIAYEMSKSIVKLTNANIGISITGNCGPNPIENKPIGLYYVGININNNINVFKFNLSPRLTRYKQQYIISKCALKKLYELLK